MFYHAWDSKDDYKVAPWRTVDVKPLKDINEVEQLYHPERFLVEMSRSFHVDPTTKGYNMAPAAQQKNASNILSQIHSRQQVRNLFKQYIEETKEVYDLVIMTRFDINISGLPVFDGKKLLFPGTHPERPHIFNDTLFMATPDDFLAAMDMEDNITRYVTTGVNGEAIQLNMEELLSGSLIDHGLFAKCQKTNEVDVALF